MRYVSLAYGTKAEIEQVFVDGMRKTRSARRQADAAQALADLQAGETGIEFGKTIYMIEDEPVTVEDLARRAQHDPEWAEIATDLPTSDDVRRMSVGVTCRR